MFRSRIFTVLSFTFRSTNHFELIFVVCSVRMGWGSFFFFLELMDIQSFLHHLLKSNPFSVELPWLLCWKSIGCMCVERLSLIRHFSIIMGEFQQRHSGFLDVWGGLEGVLSWWLLSEVWLRVVSGERCYCEVRVRSVRRWESLRDGFRQ